MENFFLKLLTLFGLLTITISQLTADTNGCPKERCQSNGQCVDNIALCPIAISCPNGFTKTNQFTCSRDDKNVIQSSCDSDLKTCWDNTCVADLTLCPSMPTCPSSNTVRCSDNSCVRSPDDCPKYVNCPSFIPVRCPNGDCRRNLKDCPGLIQCPSEFTVLCNDGSCRMTSDECDVPAQQTQCNDQTMTRCPDGTCTSSKFLCSTPKTCPTGTVLCWDASCAENFTKCEKPIVSQSNSCSNSALVKCALDGSCKPNISQCPTAKICPTDKPVRCWDFSCKETLTKCPAWQECPEGTTKCHDGTCTAISCGTHLTCSMDAPFKCYDNTCRRNPSDCPVAPECPSKFPILCWDGKCVNNRFDCLPPDLCPVTEPVKCPDNMCRKTVDECRVTNDCPTGFIRCVDGTCKRKSSDCVEPTCPLNFPNKCENGQCVVNPFNCEKENGCPFYYPIKCKDGSCVKSSENCSGIKEDLCIGVDMKLCRDGSCLPSSQICPLENGCPADTPFRCANGSCIDNTKNTCPVPICPPETPIKCLFGLCVVSESACPSNYDTENVLSDSECPDGLNPCADGKCVANPEECKSVFNCPIGYERCNDGSCRTVKEYCPIANTCPSSRNYRCQDGSCAKDVDFCINLSGCPMSSPIKCSNSGFCVDEQYKCNQLEDIFPRANGCDKTNPLKCLTGKCVNDLNQCAELSDCPSDKVYCPNTGTCAESLRDCITLGETCPEGFVRCTKDGMCKPSYLECLNGSGCTVKSPFRCISGGCKKFPNSLASSSSADDFCDLSIQCPDHKPYLCADGSCAEKSSFCKSLLNCPVDTPVRCFDRRCVATSDQCSERNRCPAKNPMLCNISGNCVASIFDCTDDSCSPLDPYKCSNGNCVKSPRLCVSNEFTTNTVCLENEATCYDGTCRKEMSLCPVYPGCTGTILIFKCPDGSCALNEKECPEIVESPSCPVGNSLCEDGICRNICPEYSGCPNNKPIACPTGICVNTISECAGQSNCEDVDYPFRCLDGSCVQSISLCRRAKRDFVGTDIQIFAAAGKTIETEIIIGENNDLIGSIKISSKTFIRVEKPVVPTPAPSPVNPSPPSPVNPSPVNPTPPPSNNTDPVVPKNDTEPIKNNTRMLQSSNSTVPETPSFNTNIPAEATLIIKSVAPSKIRSAKASYNATRQDDVIKIFPFADEKNDLSLEYEYSVLSAVVEIKIKEDNVAIKNMMVLMLAYDFPYLHEALKVKDDDQKTEDDILLSPLNDVCLGKLSLNNAWVCTTGAISTKAGVNFQLFGGVSEPGIYAVIMYPQPNNATVDSVPNFLAKYIIIILVASLSFIIVFFVALYVFIRIYRYRGKYKESREESKQYEQKMQEMQMIGTTHLGQTLGDNLDNIIYTSNPSFRIVKQEGPNKRVEELTNLQDNMLKRYRALEKNNDQLKTTYESLNKEYGRLQEYKEQVIKLQTEENIVKSEEDV